MTEKVLIEVIGNNGPKLLYGDKGGVNASEFPIATDTTSSVTATSDGTGTGQIADGVDFVTVTSDDANHIVTLPTATPGTTIALYVPTTGYKLAGAINGGDGTSSIPADTLTVCACAVADAWRCTDQAADGSVVTTAVAS